MGHNEQIEIVSACLGWEMGHGRLPLDEWLDIVGKMLRVPRFTDERTGGRVVDVTDECQRAIEQV